MFCTRFPGGLATGLLEILVQELLPLTWGCERDPRHAGSGPNHLHTSLLGRRALGNPGLSVPCWAPTESASGCGAAYHTQGPWEPGVLPAALICVAKPQLEKPSSCPSLPSDRALTAGALGSVQATGP